MSTTERRALVSEKQAILRSIREARRAHCGMACFRNADGSPAHPMIARLDRINALLSNSNGN